VAVSGALWEVLAAAQDCWCWSRGAFDPTVGPLMRAWGLDGGSGRIPPPEELEALLEVCGMHHVHIDPESRLVRFDRPGVALDLGGIGKGYIADRAVELVRARGVDSGALLSGRSSILIWGRDPDGGPWRLGAADPEAPDATWLEIQAAEGAVSSSAAYERRVEIDGRAYGHLLDPRTGRPAERCLAVTVWTPRAMAGDALSTALAVLGLEAGREVLEDFARAQPASALVMSKDESRWGGRRWDLLEPGPKGLLQVKET
jgi:thiamine biosynthesis lipoprotein